MIASRQLWCGLTRQGVTALMTASNYGQFECVRLLLAAGARVGLVDAEGRDALQVTHTLTHSHTHTLTHPHTHTLTHSHTHALTHAHTHTLTHSH